MRSVNHGNTGYDGITYWSCDPVNKQMLRPTYTDYNTYLTDQPQYSANALESIMVHELGHAVGLDHSGSMPCSVPIMYFSSARFFTCSEILPQQDDINGINFLYP
jgi:predicted Zn-dependent protease